MTDYRHQLSLNAASALARQTALSDYLGDHRWDVDLGAGTVDFGDNRVFPLQLLGSESESSQTWLWAWANTQSNLPPPVVEAVHGIRDSGEQLGIAQLQEPKIALDVADGHELSLLCSGLIGECCYYRGPYDGGALYFLVGELPPQIFAPVDLPRALTVMSDVIATYDLDHRVAAGSFLEAQGFTVSEEDGHLIGRRDGDALDFGFDAEGLLTGISAQSKPQ